VKKKLDLYGVSFVSYMIIDRWIYRGRGRPRKTDYAPIWLLQNKINAMTNKYLDALHDIYIPKVGPGVKKLLPKLDPK
jgi:hypothetical protein